MSTEKIREALKDLREWTRSYGEQAGTGTQSELADEAERELEAIEKAAKDMTRLNAGDMTYAIRETEAALDWAQANDRPTWDAPDVKAWSDAAQVLASIASEAK